MIRSPFGARSLLAIIAIFACFLTFVPSAVASDQSDTARAQAKKILSEKQYGKDANRPLSGDVQRLSRWLGAGKNKAQIKHRTDKEIQQKSAPAKRKPAVSPPGLGGLSGIGQIILYIAIAAAIGGIGFMIYKGVRGREKKEKSDDDEEPSDIDWSDEEKVLEYVTDAELLERLSDQAENAGQLDLALRYRFRAGLLRLNDQGVISFHPSITNAQWQLLLNSDEFNSLTRDFNDVTYGQRTCDTSHLSRARTGWAMLVKAHSEKSSRAQS